MRFSDLSNDLLIESYKKAIDLQLDQSFIKILEKEIEIRDLVIEKKYRRQMIY
ncbi:sporulation histidine kinase inhibitor Sda [Aquibacillus rhizosphaerae]|uniref:Sporulation histidine kinase inhibitor Sda n=1 Tax=Aquibacillus rhizosphaerae TaxID=3051431 RepID=A0ABT7L5Y9_9BACI|nr:sporulation histidine kinase inhibitor Sda [Aquibacillus sp. LR5S19]MDL4841283.1 sporulation histidine kinase inhibitor Sda [Aquibacillus sp. LR5S19]